jgi:ADP-ribosyl-[dinitrogen reductase] hydrolase
LAGAEPRRTISEYAQRVHPPQITGAQLFAAYRDHQGPGNIPKREMWKFHTLLADAPYEMDRLVREDSEATVINHLFATACYPEHGLPLLFYFAKVHNVDVESALLANANAGGDNVHRGMVLGILVGAANKELPAHLKQGLIEFNKIQTEIEAFSDIALSGYAI